VTRSDNNHQEFYTGVTAQTMKGRYNGHTYNFRHRADPDDPNSKYIWLLKDINVNYRVFFIESGKLICYKMLKI